jgi:hypothetical protein
LTERVNNDRNCNGHVISLKSHGFLANNSHTLDFKTIDRQVIFLDYDLRPRIEIETWEALRFFGSRALFEVLKVS